MFFPPFFPRSDYNPFARLRAVCHHLSMNRFLCVPCSLSAGCSMNSGKAMPPKSRYACTTCSSSYLKPSSLECAKGARGPYWRCSTCIQQWSKPHRRSTSLTMIKTMRGALSGTGRKCPSPSHIRLLLRKVQLTSLQKRCLKESSK